MNRRLRLPSAPVRLPSAALGAAVVLAVVLAACRAMPVPVDVDLVPHLGDLSSGSHTVEVPAGAVPDRSPVRYPSAQGDCIDVGQDLHVRLEHATITYDIVIGYQGPPLDGIVTGQPYVAPEGGALWSAAYALGAPVTGDLADGSARLGGTVVANDTQLAAINAGTICWGLELRGDGLASPDGGSATITYEVVELRLRGGVSLF